MASWKLVVVNHLAQIFLKPLSDKLSVQTNRRLLQLRRAASLPVGMTRTDRLLGDVPVAVFTPPNPLPGTCIFYMHGGGHNSGSPDSHSAFLSLLGMTTSRRIIATDHRLAPEHPFPAGFQDVVSAYDQLIAEGADPSGVILMGESAGGNFVFALLHELCARGRPPGLAIALSPWTDLRAEGSSRTASSRTDRVLGPKAIEQMAIMYLGSADPADPRISPVLGAYAGAPPVLIQAAESERLFEDARLMAERLESFGVDVRLQSWPDAIHTFQVVCPGLDESRDALNSILEFMQSKLAATRPRS